MIGYYRLSTSNLICYGHVCITSIYKSDWLLLCLFNKCKWLFSRLNNMFILKMKYNVLRDSILLVAGWCNYIRGTVNVTGYCHVCTRNLIGWCRVCKKKSDLLLSCLHNKSFWLLLCLYYLWIWVTAVVFIQPGSYCRVCTTVLIEKCRFCATNLIGFYRSAMSSLYNRSLWLLSLVQ